MNLNILLKHYADQIGGQYTEIDQHGCIIIVPVSGGRFQTVSGAISQHESLNRKFISLQSKVCLANLEIDYKMLLGQAAHFNYCRFIIKENYLKVEAVAQLIGTSEETIKEMVQEVASIADQFEMKLANVDIR